MIHVPNAATACSLLPPLAPLTQTTPLAVRDSRWLQLEVCSEFSHGSCQQEECFLAHPPTHVKVDNDFVTVCYDYIKRKECKHSNCKYYHPPQHLVDNVLRKGDENKKVRDQQHQEYCARSVYSVQPQLWATPQQVNPFLSPYANLLQSSQAAHQFGQLTPQQSAAAFSLQQARQFGLSPQAALVQDQSPPLEVAYQGQSSAALAAAYASAVAMATRGPMKRPAGIDSPTPDPSQLQSWQLGAPATKRPNLAGADSPPQHPQQQAQQMPMMQPQQLASCTPSLPASSLPSNVIVSSASAAAHALNGLLMTSPTNPGQHHPLYASSLMHALQGGHQPGAPGVPRGLPGAPPTAHPAAASLMLSQFLRAQAPSYLSYPSACPSTATASLAAQLSDANGLMFNAPSFNQSAINPPTNVAYINDKGQLLETLPICRDFKAGKCHRNSECRYVHLLDENVEVTNGRLTVCRDAAKGRCLRNPCKYYHVPLITGNYMLNSLGTM